MATQISAILQNENVQIPRGKGIEGLKADPLKSEGKEHKDRKALADLSKPEKPFTAAKGSALKVNSSLHGNKTIKKAPKTTIFSDEVKKGRHSLLDSETTKKTPKSSILTDEEIKKCHEWAREGIEKVHFTGNDLRRHENDAIEKRVEKKVDMIMSSMSKWNQVLYDCITPVKKYTDDVGGIKGLEPEPEVFFPPAALLPTSGFDEDEYSLLEEPEILWPFGEHNEHRSELKLKEEMKGVLLFR